MTPAKFLKKWGNMYQPGGSIYEFEADLAALLAEREQAVMMPMQRALSLVSAMAYPYMNLRDLDQNGVDAASRMMQIVMPLCQPEAAKEPP